MFELLGETPSPFAVKTMSIRSKPSPPNAGGCIPKPETKNPPAWRACPRRWAGYAWLLEPWITSEILGSHRRAFDQSCSETDDHEAHSARDQRAKERLFSGRERKVFHGSALELPFTPPTARGNAACDKHLQRRLLNAPRRCSGLASRAAPSAAPRHARFRSDRQDFGPYRSRASYAHTLPRRKPLARGRREIGAETHDPPLSDRAISR